MIRLKSVLFVTLALALSPSVFAESTAAPAAVAQDHHEASAFFTSVVGHWRGSGTAVDTDQYGRKFARSYSLHSHIDQTAVNAWSLMSMTRDQFGREYKQHVQVVVTGGDLLIGSAGGPLERAIILESNDHSLTYEIDRRDRYGRLIQYVFTLCHENNQLTGHNEGYVNGFQFREDAFSMDAHQHP
jgi:hypothetical protein